MSVIEEAIVSILIAAATAAGSRIYPQLLPPEVTLPAIAYTRISTPRVRSLTGFSHLARPRFQLTAWANSKNAAKTLADEIFAVLDSYSGTVLGVIIQISFADNELDTYEPTPEMYGVLTDYMIAHTE